MLAGAFVTAGLCENTNPGDTSKTVKPAPKAPSKSPASKPVKSATQKVRFSKPIDYSAAGLSVALPRGYSYQQLFEEYQVLLASDISLGKISRSISIMALPVTMKTDSKSIIKILVDDKKNNILFRYFKTENLNDNLKISGQNVSAIMMSYTHRGIKTVAASVCVTRDIKLAKEHVQDKCKTVRVAYILVFEAAETDKNYLKKMLPEICKNIKFTKFIRPANLKISTEPDHCQYINLPTKGYGIKVPNHWIGDTNEIGIAIWTTDYKAGGIANPGMQILNFLVPVGVDAKSLGQKSIEYEQKKTKAKIEILSQKEVKISGKLGYQYVLKKTIDPAAIEKENANQKSKTADAKTRKKSDDKNSTQAKDKKNTPAKSLEKSGKNCKPIKPISVIEVQRLVCVKSKKNPKKQRYFALILTCHDITEKQAVKIMDKLCKRFVIYKPKKLTVEIKRPKPGDLELPPDIKDKLEEK